MKQAFPDTAAAHPLGASAGSPESKRDEVKNVVETFWVASLQTNDLRFHSRNVAIAIARIPIAMATAGM